VPYINGRFYMNPAYGSAVEHVRAAEAASTHDKSGQQELGTHWVTIEGRHVLIHETQGERAPQGNQSQPRPPAKIQFPSSES